MFYYLSFLQEHKIQINITMSSQIMAPLVRALDNNKDSPIAGTGVGPSLKSGHHIIRQNGQSPDSLHFLFSFPNISKIILKIGSFSLLRERFRLEQQHLGIHPATSARNLTQFSLAIPKNIG